MMMKLTSEAVGPEMWDATLSVPQRACCSSSQTELVLSGGYTPSRVRSYPRRMALLLSLNTETCRSAMSASEDSRTRLRGTRSGKSSLLLRSS